MELKKISPLTQKIFWHILQLSVVCCGIYTGVWMKLLQSFCFSPEAFIVYVWCLLCILHVYLCTDSRLIQKMFKKHVWNCSLTLKFVCYMGLVSTTCSSLKTPNPLNTSIGISSCRFHSKFDFTHNVQNWHFLNKGSGWIV